MRHACPATFLLPVCNEDPHTVKSIVRRHRSSGPQFEESLLSASMEQLAGDDEEGGGADGGDDGTDFLLKDDGNDLDLR